MNGVTTVACNLTNNPYHTCAPLYTLTHQRCVCVRVRVCARGHLQREDK
jgi:hypothetical protein